MKPRVIALLTIALSACQQNGGSIEGRAAVTAEVDDENQGERSTPKASSVGNDSEEGEGTQSVADDPSQGTAAAVAEEQVDVEPQLSSELISRVEAASATKVDAPRSLSGEQKTLSVASEVLDDSAWEEFKRAAKRSDAAGVAYYVVEWDLPVLTEGDLRNYFDTMNSGRLDKGVVHRVPGTTTDDVWSRSDALRIRYCVDANATTGFDAPGSSASSATIIAAMAEATLAWHNVANVNFEYDAANNNNCGVSSTVPDTRYFKVSRNESLGSPCAFGPLSRSAWTCAGLDGNTIGVPTTYIGGGAPPGFTWAGTMMHEVGHVLGLHHEQFHTSGGGCSASDVRNVTATADLQSIMGYPNGSGGCALTTPNLTSLSVQDGWTVRQFYGPPAAWYVQITS